MAAVTSTVILEPLKIKTVTVSLFSSSICPEVMDRMPWSSGEGNGTPLQSSCLENPMDGGAWWAAVHEVAKSRTWLRDFTFPFHFHALEKEMATHSSILAWRIPGMGKPGGLPSKGSHRVGNDWCNLAAAVAMIFIFWMLSFKPDFSLFSFTFWMCANIIYVYISRDIYFFLTWIAYMLFRNK